MKYFVDWGHFDEKVVFYDGKKILKKKPKLQAGDEIYCENIPLKISKPLLDAGVLIFRVHQNLVAAFREEQNIDKSDENDALAIYMYYNEHTEDFKPYVGEDPLKLLYATFKEIQKLRVSTGNRVWAAGKDENNSRTMKEIEKMEENVKRDMLVELERFPVWSWLKEIKGIGVATSAGLIAHIGDISRFEHRGNLYSFAGLKVIDGVAQKKKKGETMNANQDLKALLIGVIADSFNKQRTETYREIYDTTKQTELAKKYAPGYLAGLYHGYKKEDTHLLLNHAHKRALRKTAKLFLSHYWEVSRYLQDLPVEAPYAQAKLGHESYIRPPHAPKGFRTPRMPQVIGESLASPVFIQTHTLEPTFETVK